MFQIAVCEDEREQSKALLTLLDEYRAARPGTDMTARVYGCAAELLSAPEGLACDLYLLDILMPGLNGIELARKLRAHDADTPLIFLTASVDFALEAFNVSASQYLLKPVTRDALFAALDKTVAARERDEGRFIMIPTRESTVRVLFSSIVSVELAGRVLRVVLADGGLLYSKTVRVPFAEAVTPLLTDERFLSAHKSFVINMARVREMTPRSFVMEGGGEVPIPRNKYADAKNKYFNYLSARGIGSLLTPLGGGDQHAR